MKHAITTVDRIASLRLHPGDDLLASLGHGLDLLGASGAVVLSCVGSLQELCYAGAAVDRDGVPSYSKPVTLSEPVEVISLQGHLGRDSDGAAQCHLHGSFARADGRLVAGHVMSATTLVTIEASILTGTNLTWRRRSTPVAPGRFLPTFEPEVSDGATS